MGLSGRREGKLILTGVGGQGLITMGRALGEALLLEGYKVRIAEVHGLAQRGGSVVVHVKYSGDEIGPTVSPGEADAVIALEIIEGARALTFLKEGGLLLLNDILIPPVGAKQVPEKEELLSFLRKNGVKYSLVKATEKAREVGSTLFTNAVMLGVAFEAGLIPVSERNIEFAVKKAFRRKTELNLAAFREGRKLWREKR